MPQQSLELGPSSVTVRKCPNNVSNWGLLRLLSKNASTMPRNGNFLSYCQKMPKHCLKLGPSSVTVRKCLNNASNWGLPQLLSGNAPKCLELGPSSVTVRKCLNNASNWGLPQLMSWNASTMPWPEAFLSCCQEMPAQCLELGNFLPLSVWLFTNPSMSHTSDSWQRLHRNSVSPPAEFYSSWNTDATTWHFYSWCVVTDIITIAYFCDSCTKRNIGRAPHLREVACLHFLYTPGLAKFASVIHDVHRNIYTSSYRYAVLSITWHDRKAFDFPWDITRRKKSRDNWAPVTTAWHIIGLRMEERPPIWKSSCDYIE